MYFVFGTRLFGKVDHVPGVFHVATQFAHVNYIPLVPTKSWLVTSKSGNGWQGVPIPISAKSILIAWARCAFVIGIGAGFFMTLAGLTKTSQDSALAIGGGLLFAACLAAMIGSYYIPGVGRATRGRLTSLGQQIGLSADAIDDLVFAALKLPPASGFPVQPAKRQSPPPLPVNVQSVQDH